MHKYRSGIPPQDLDRYLTAQRTAVIRLTGHDPVVEFSRATGSDRYTLRDGSVLSLRQAGEAVYRLRLRLEAGDMVPEYTA